MTPNEIRTKRRALDLSQEQLATLVGVDRSYISKIESGEREPGPDTMGKLAMALGDVASTAPGDVHGVTSQGDVTWRDHALLPGIFRLEVVGPSRWEEGTVLSFSRVASVAPGDWVCAGKTGATTALFGRLSPIGDVEAIETDSRGHVVVLVRGLVVLGRLVESVRKYD